MKSCMHLITILFITLLRNLNNNRNRIDKTMWLFLFFGVVSSQRRRGWILGKRRTLILTTAAITDLSQEKLLYHMVYFGMTGGSPSFILLKASAGVFCSFLFFFSDVLYVDWIFEKEDERFHFFLCSSSELFFSFVRNIFWTWECWLKQILTVHGNPFYQKEKL